MAKKVVLGFSGGLDTTFCVKHLSEEMGYEVHSIIVNTGGFSEEELKKIPLDIREHERAFVQMGIVPTWNR